MIAAETSSERQTVFTSCTGLPNLYPAYLRDRSLRLPLSKRNRMVALNKAAKRNMIA